MHGGEDGAVKKAVVAAVVLGLLLAAAPASLAAGLSVYPLGLPTIELEMPRNDWGSWASFNVYGISGQPRLGSEFDVSATALGGGVRYYLDGVARGGVYLGGYAGLYCLSGRYNSADTLARALLVTAASGYKWTFADFFVDVGARVSFPLVADEANNLYDAQKVFHQTFGTQVQVGVGISF